MKNSFISYEKIIDEACRMMLEISQLLRMESDCGDNCQFIILAHSIQRVNHCQMKMKENPHPLTLAEEHKLLEDSVNLFLAGLKMKLIGVIISGNSRIEQTWYHDGLVKQMIGQARIYDVLDQIRWKISTTQGS